MLGYCCCEGWQPQTGARNAAACRTASCAADDATAKTLRRALFADVEGRFPFCKRARLRAQGKGFAGCLKGRRDEGQLEGEGKRVLVVFNA